MSNPLSNAFPLYVEMRWPRHANVTPVGLVKSRDEELAERHLDARFERVRRRWNAKHPRSRTYVPFVIDLPAITGPAKT